MVLLKASPEATTLVLLAPGPVHRAKILTTYGPIPTREVEMAGLDNETADLTCKKLGQLVVGAVKATNELPVGKDYDFYKSFKDFKSKLAAGPSVESGAGKRILKLMDKIMSHQSPNAPPSRFAQRECIDEEDLMESVVDFADGRLERVDHIIDDLLGRSASVKTQRVGLDGMNGKGRAWDGRSKRFGLRSTLQVMLNIRSTLQVMLNINIA